MNRYEVRPWVCDTGIYDVIKNEFVGNPFYSKKFAEVACQIMNMDNRKAIKNSQSLAPP